MKYRNQIILVLVALGSIFFISYFVGNPERFKNKYKYFYSHDMSGIIKESHPNIGATCVTLENSNIEYMFVTIDYSRDPAFSYLSEPGDSVYKPAYNDSITLYKKNGKVYKYSFRKY